ncbi:MAG: CoA transferase [Spirochaetota bacterium]|nr:CoA transferase [Spirochaetota bacterium]
MNKFPLDGIRVLDFTFMWAGPYATMLLGFMGAEVIKVESQRRLDTIRIFDLVNLQMLEDINMSPIFNDINLSKLGINLDLKNTKAIEIAKRLIEKCDVVMENMRPGVMDRLGLGYEVACELNPSIIYLASSSRGAKGPERNYTGYAPSFGALSGLSNVTGHPNDPPSTIGGEIDLLSGLTSVYAILAALNYRKSTGEGQYIDQSSSEAGSVLIGELFMDYFMNGNVQTRQGNMDDHMAPHNCYPCKGENKWISIAIETEDEWLSFCNAIGNPEWTRDDRFSDVKSRLVNREELDKLISEWTMIYDPYEAMRRLQSAGVAAVQKYNSQDLFSDPHLKERDFAMKVTHPAIGDMICLAPPFKYSTLSVKFEHAPLFGQHNNYIFGELLGMSENEILKLREDGVIG